MEYTPVCDVVKSRVPPKLALSLLARSRPPVGDMQRVL
jgi:hypothetical protein